MQRRESSDSKPENGNLPTESNDLEALLDFKSITQFQKYFTLQELDAIAKKSPIVQKIEQLHPHTQAFRRGLNKSVIPIDIWCFLTGITGIAIFGVSALHVTLASLAAGLLIGGYYFYSSYQEQKQKMLEFHQSVAMADIKLQAVSKLIKSKQEALQRIADSHDSLTESNIAALTHIVQTAITPRPTLFTASKPISEPSKEKSFYIGSAVFLTLGVSYIAGAGFLFQSMGVFAATALTGPIGWGILAGVLLFAICAGVYFGYRHYQDNLVRYQMDQFKVEKEKEFDTKYTEYKTLTVKHGWMDKHDDIIIRAPSPSASPLRANSLLRRPASRAPASPTRQQQQHVTMNAHCH